MKFYDREIEIAALREIREKSRRNARFTVVTGRRRVGKTQLIKRAFESKWDKPPWSDTLKPIVVRCWFGSGGRLVNSRIIQSSGDRHADAKIAMAAKLVRAVPGLTADFIDKYKGEGIDVRFTVTPK